MLLWGSMHYQDLAPVFCLFSDIKKILVRRPFIEKEEVIVETEAKIGITKVLQIYWKDFFYIFHGNKNFSRFTCF